VCLLLVFGKSFVCVCCLCVFAVCCFCDVCVGFGGVGEDFLYLHLFTGVDVVSL
jgi:hypothetical protein